MMRTWSFSSAGTLFFGRHAVRHHLRDACERLGARRAFIVTDAILVKAGLLSQVAEPLTQSGVTSESFDRVTPEPGVELVHEAIAAARSFRPDVVIGLGGGSNMDTAKLVAMILAHGGDPLDYTGDCRVPGPVRPGISWQPASSAAVASRRIGLVMVSPPPACPEASDLSRRAPVRCRATLAVRPRSRRRRSWAFRP